MSSKQDLIDELVELGVDADSIEGTGYNGYVTMDDLREALASAKRPTSVHTTDASFVSVEEAEAIADSDEPAKGVRL